MSTTTSSLVGNINQLIGGLDSFEVYCNEEKMIKIKQNGSLYTVGNLNPGQVYKCSAATLFCNRTSVKSNIVKECTVPASPHFEIVKMSTTTSSLVGIINQLIGGHDSFEVYCNEERMIKIKQNGSLYKVGNLNPGQVYKCSAATLFCNRTSVKSNIVKECTVPASPDFKIVNMSTTTNSLVGNINQLIGRHDSFEIHCNGKKMIKVKQNGSMYTVGNLNPGQVYKCSAATLFCNRTSVESNTVKECTVPSPPRFTINNQSTTINTFHGSISQRNGGKDKFTLYCNGTQNLKFSINGSEYFINNLNPGTRYSCQASTTFCDHTSEKTTSLQECTVPSTPLIKTVGKTTTSSTLQIINPGGKVRFYRIIINRNTSLPLIPYQSSTQKYNITNLKPGAHYTISAVAVSNGINSSPSSEINVFTVPGQPRSISVLQGMNYSDITVVPPRGAVDFYTFLSSSVCLSSNMIKSSYILETISNKKNLLRLRTEPGVCCMLYVVAVSNNITSTPLNSTIKRPESVPGKVDYQYMHILENSVTIFWSVPQHPNGIVAKYTLTFWSNDKIASIKFTCVDCPGANDCSFLSHKQMKSETFTGSTTFKDINSTIPFKWRQTKFIFTIDKLQQYSNYSFTIWTSTQQGNGPVFSSSFRTVKGHKQQSTSNGPITAGTIVGSIVGTVIILIIGRFVYRWYYRRVKGNATKTDGRSQQYEDISPETDANVYETLDIAM